MKNKASPHGAGEQCVQLWLAWQDKQAANHIDVEGRHEEAPEKLLAESAAPAARSDNMPPHRAGRGCAA